MILETTKIINGIFKVTVFTSSHHYLFEKVVSALDKVDAEKRIRFFIETHLIGGVS